LIRDKQSAAVVVGKLKDMKVNN